MDFGTFYLIGAVVTFILQVRSAARSVRFPDDETEDVKDIAIVAALSAIFWPLWVVFNVVVFVTNILVRYFR